MNTDHFHNQLALHLGYERILDRNIDIHVDDSKDEIWVTIEVKKANFEECVFIEDYEPNSKKVACDVMTEMNDYVQQQSIAELEKLMKEKASRGEIPTQEWVNQVRPQVLKNVFPIKDYQLGKKFTDGLNGLLYNIVLNKQQY